MGTKLDRLRNTLTLAHHTWSAEQRCQATNATNESAWSVQVMEPLLAALDWPRLPQGDEGTGAYYEWPVEKHVDVALLVGGRPRGYVELKGKQDACERDVRTRLDKDPALRDAASAVAAWHSPAGLRVYEVRPGSVLVSRPACSLADLCHDPRELAQLAAPVLKGEVVEHGEWLGSPAADAGAIRPRFRPREVQARFFELLRQRLGLVRPLEPKDACGGRHPPTPTKAFAELPGVLPTGWGLALSIYPTVNDLRCLFYRGSSKKAGDAGKWTFDGRVLDDAALEEFLRDRVLPNIERWRRKAVADGIMSATALR